MATVQEWGKGSVWVGWQKFDTSQDAFKISQNISNKFLHAELSECVKKMCGYKGKNTLKMTKNYVKLVRGLWKKQTNWKAVKKFP